MIFMRALLTTIIGQCRVKALNTELAIACLYKAVMRFMTSQNAPKVPHLLLMVFIAHNDIHGSLQEGYNPGRVGERLREKKNPLQPHKLFPADSGPHTDS